MTLASPILVLTLAAPARPPLAHEALWLMKGVGAPAPSPDGKWVVVPVGEPAYDEKDEVSDLWIVPADASARPRRLTGGKGGESDPAWSPDSRRLAFVAKREGDEAGQVYLLDLTGGEAQRLTSLTLGARAPKWSPDGKWLLFQSLVFRGAADEASNKKLNEERKQAKTRVRAYESFPIRSWDKWLDDRQTHLFVVPADDGSKARDLLAGSALVKASGFRGSGGDLGGDDLAPAWAPDGRSIVIAATTAADTAAYADPATQLWEVAVAGGEPKPLTSGDVSYGGARFSPDGKTVCFESNDGKGKIYALDRVACGAWPWTGAPSLATASLDRSVSSFAFGPDSRSLYVSAEDAGHVRIWRVPVAGGEARLAVDAPRGAWRGFAVPEKASPAMLVASWESAVNPAEVVKVDLASGKQTLLTAFNTEKAAALDWPPLREFSFSSRSGRSLHSFLALPPAFDESKKYPLLVLIHGGHANMWTDTITRRWNYHLLAAPGYVVLLTDYRGSTGYGEKFTLDILGDPLRGPADDVNEAADEAIRRFPFVDGARQAAAGASYGGHLVNWLEASTTRYKCLIGHAGLASLYGQWATSDVIHHRELMLGGLFWENPRKWLDQSPTSYASDFKTPMLLSVGESDFRVPIGNTLEMWSVLQRMRVPSRLLVWPDANHWITKAEDSRRFYEEVRSWLAKWL